MFRSVLVLKSLEPSENFANATNVLACHDRSDGVSSVRENRLIQSEKVTSAREVQRLIGEKLKAQYDLEEPIPDRLVELLKQLAQRVDERDDETG
jgi:hypothetical protein